MRDRAGLPDPVLLEERVMRNCFSRCSRSSDAHQDILVGPFALEGAKGVSACTGPYTPCVCTDTDLRLSVSAPPTKRDVVPVVFSSLLIQSIRFSQFDDLVLELVDRCGGERGLGDVSK